MITKYQRWLKLTKDLIEDNALIVEHYPGKNDCLIDPYGWGRAMQVTGIMVLSDEVHLFVDYPENVEKEPTFVDHTEKDREMRKEALTS